MSDYIQQSSCEINEFHWNCSTKDLIDQQIKQICNTKSVHGTRKVKNLVKRTLKITTTNPLWIQGIGATNLYNNLTDELIDTISPEEKFVEKNLFFRDIAKDEINNPISTLPWVGRMANRAGQKKNNSEERVLIKIQSEHGKIKHRVYEISKENIANISYFLTDKGVCIPARRMCFEDADLLERSRLIKNSFVTEWFKDNIFCKVIFSTNKDFLYDIKKLSDLIQSPKKIKMISKSDNQEYEILNTENKRFIILDKPLGSDA